MIITKKNPTLPHQQGTRQNVLPTLNQRTAITSTIIPSKIMTCCSKINSICSKNIETSSFLSSLSLASREKIRTLLSSFNVRDFVIDEAQIDFVEKRHDPHHDRWPHGKYLRSSESDRHDTFQDYFSAFHSRVKRQQPPGNENLCTARTSYINPQAAMNSRGNWMFLVNGVDSVTQQIRTETCS